MQGKKNVRVQEISCGDIGAVATRISATPKQATPCATARPWGATRGHHLYSPCYSMCISPKVKGQEDKIGSGPHPSGREETAPSPSPTTARHIEWSSPAPATSIWTCCAQAEEQVRRGKWAFPARVPYREKIRKSAKATAATKQTGGHGQFADVKIHRFEPTGGAGGYGLCRGGVRRQRAQEPSPPLRACASAWSRASWPATPRVYLKATLFDGDFHPVDSPPKWRSRPPQAWPIRSWSTPRPVILEPIGSLKVTIPDANMGDIMSDISSKRRGFRDGHER